MNSRGPYKICRKKVRGFNLASGASGTSGGLGCVKRPPVPSNLSTWVDGLGSPVSRKMLFTGETISLDLVQRKGTRPPGKRTPPTKKKNSSGKAKGRSTPIRNDLRNAAAEHSEVHSEN